MGDVLVTGGSGFVGSHTILQLLAAGHRVRTTVREPGREDGLRAMLEQGGQAPGDHLTVVVADLSADAGWQEAVTGCEFVLHVASPFPAGLPKHEDELIVPAVEGTLRVLRASRDAGVKRVVMTSSFAAVGYGHPERREPFDETSWTDTRSADVQPYIKSKTLAERAAWDFIAQEGGNLELSVINPVGIFGPTLGPKLSGSVQIIKNMLDGAMPACPRIYFGVVDVRDVADLHLRAMTHPAAKGERFLAVAGASVSMFEVASILRARLGTAASKAPKREIPDWLMRVSALFNPAARKALPQVGKRRSASGEKAKRLLGWEPRSNEEAIASCGESLG